jgi:hypothetical protein
MLSEMRSLVLAATIVTAVGVALPAADIQFPGAWSSSPVWASAALRGGAVLGPDPHSQGSVVPESLGSTVGRESAGRESLTRLGNPKGTGPIPTRE